MSSNKQALLVKRCVDVVGASVAIVLTAPLQVGAAGAVRLTMGAPVLFRQQRPGLGARPFEMFKFRTMIESGAQSGADGYAQRVTPIGRWLRATSIDELPALWNVLRGDMSLVGPRPLLMKYLPRYSAWQFRRHEMKPGLTGLAQISGRNSLTWEEKFKLDVEYIDHWNFWLDLRILLKTFGRVISQSGINHDENVTMPEFQGPSH